eukprot:2733247-Alexandrium_andersonii.AAC.1
MPTTAPAAAPSTLAGALHIAFLAACPRWCWSLVPAGVERGQWPETWSTCSAPSARETPWDLRRLRERNRICPAAWSPMRNSSADSSSAGSPEALPILSVVPRIPLAGP